MGVQRKTNKRKQYTSEFKRERVSTQEQTKGDYPSCDSQLENLTAYAKQKGWEIVASIKDEGYSAGSLRRPGLTKIRRMAQDGAIDFVLSGWYDRFTRNPPEFFEVNRAPAKV